MGVAANDGGRTSYVAGSGRPAQAGGGSGVSDEPRQLDWKLRPNGRCLAHC